VVLIGSIKGEAAVGIEDDGYPSPPLPPVQGESVEKGGPGRLEVPRIKAHSFEEVVAVYEKVNRHRSYDRKLKG